MLQLQFIRVIPDATFCHICARSSDLGCSRIRIICAVAAALGILLMVAPAVHVSRHRYTTRNGLLGGSKHHRQKRQYRRKGKKCQALPSISTLHQPSNSLNDQHEQRKVLGADWQKDGEITTADVERTGDYVEMDGARQNGREHGE